MDNICFHTKVKKNGFFLKFNAKKRGGELVLPPSTFQSGEGNCQSYKSFLINFGSFS